MTDAPKQRRLTLFLSYAAEQLELAERLQLALVNAGHEVFFDRTSIPPGKDYNPAILRALRGCDLLVFLISPESVEPGAYALAELRLAREVWSSPEGHILPVMAASTPMDAVPAYLRAVSILTPEGDPVPEVYAAIDRLASGWSPAQTAFGQARVVEGMSFDLRQMRLDQELRDLERRWEAQRSGLLIKVNGRPVEPTSEHAAMVLGACVMFAGFSLFTNYMSLSMKGILVIT